VRAGGGRNQGKEKGQNMTHDRPLTDHFTLHSKGQGVPETGGPHESTTAVDTNPYPGDT
jgi:hypothetical protein